MNLYFPLQHDTEPLSSSRGPAFDVSPGVLQLRPEQDRSTAVTLRSRDVLIAMVIAGMILFGFLGKAFYLQAFQGGEYRAIAENNRTRTIVEPAVRGVIYDAKGIQLVNNSASFTLTVTPFELPEDKKLRMELFEKVGDLSGINPIEFDLAISRYPNARDEEIPIPGKLDYDTAMKLYLKEESLSGFQIEMLTVRAYEKTELESLSHVLGYTGFISPDEYAENRSNGYIRTDKIGKLGIESVYEKELKGKHGSRTIEVDALGREALLIKETDPINGKNLHLTIDSELTRFIESRLSEYMERAGDRKASVIVLNPQDGGVRSLVSIPSFDNNLFAEGISGNDYVKLLEDPARPLFPRATSGEFPPGSTFKPTVAAAALEDGLINENTSFVSSGGIGIGVWYFPDWKAGGHGVTNVRKAISESVNTFFYIIGGGLGDFRGLGVERIMEQAKRFGFGGRTGIDLTSEADGFLPSKAWKEEAKGERWYIGDTYHAAIGQGDVLVSPLQMAVATSVFANKGILYEPHILGSIEAGEGKEFFSPVVRNGEVMSPSTINTVREGMRDTVRTGSARSLSLLPEAVAGKTGTAQAGGDRENHAWFTSFGPFETPELVVTVLVEEGGEGSAVAVPLARDIYAWWFANR